MIDANVFNWVVLPLLIFLARICDVSLGTVRFMLLARGRNIIAPLIGFFEVLIWLLAVRQVVFNLTNWACFIGFAGGFAMGNYIGMILEEKLAFGERVIQVITNKDAIELVSVLKSQGYGITVLKGHGSRGQVDVILLVVKRRDEGKILQIIQELAPKAFYSIYDIRSVREGIFPMMRRGIVK